MKLREIGPQLLGGVQRLVVDGALLQLEAGEAAQGAVLHRREEAFLHPVGELQLAQVLLEQLVQKGLQFLLGAVLQQLG